MFRLVFSDQSSTVFTCVTGWWSIFLLLHPIHLGELKKNIVKTSSTFICEWPLKELGRKLIWSLCWYVALFVFARLTLRDLGPWASHMRWVVWVMATGGTAYVFFFHEKYVNKCFHFYEVFLVSMFYKTFYITLRGNVWKNTLYCQMYKNTLT